MFQKNKTYSTVIIGVSITSSLSSLLPSLSDDDRELLPDYFLLPLLSVEELLSELLFEESPVFESDEEELPSAFEFDISESVLAELFSFSSEFSDKEEVFSFSTVDETVLLTTSDFFDVSPEQFTKNNAIITAVKKLPKKQI